MTRPRKLVDYPWVVVRIDCTLCGRRGRYRLARLAARYGPDQELDGLLRDLAHNCPWWNERARRSEPRCGARFSDLDHTFAPHDPPDAPVFRRRQPAREDVPKLLDTDGTRRSGDIPMLSTWRHAEIVVACSRCGRRDVLMVTQLRLAMPGGDARLTDLLASLTAGCPRRRSQSIHEQCRAVLQKPNG